MAAVWFCLGLFLGTIAGVFVVALFQMTSREFPHPDPDGMTLEPFPSVMSKVGDLGRD